MTLYKTLHDIDYMYQEKKGGRGLASIEMHQ